MRLLLSNYIPQQVSVTQTVTEYNGSPKQESERKTCAQHDTHLSQKIRSTMTWDLPMKKISMAAAILCYDDRRFGRVRQQKENRKTRAGGMKSKSKLASIHPAKRVQTSQQKSKAPKIAHSSTRPRHIWCREILFVLPSRDAT
jgi:hypothetical protein